MLSTPEYAAVPNIVHFDCFEADLDSGQLHKHGVRIKLRDQSFQVLSLLLENRGHVVTRKDLRRQLWRDEVFVDFDNNLNIIIARLREVLGDSADHPRFIETLPKRGYRFLAPISEPAPGAETSSARRAKLVVLPFVNLSGDPAQEYLSDAVTEELITALASVAPEQLAVIARTTAMHYKNSQKDIACIGRELDVNFVVEGGVRRAAHGIAVNVQLIQTTEQTHLFAKKYESLLRDVFNMQKCIAQTIAEHIPVIANQREGRMLVPPSPRKVTQNLRAYSEYIKGRYHMAKAAPQDFARAKENLERAVARDPGFASAYDALAELYWYLGYFGVWPPRRAFSTGIVHALRALEIDNTLAETHALLGQFHKSIEYNWPEVHREMVLATQLDPNSPLVRMRYAVSWLMPQGHLRQAAIELQRCLELDPLALFTRFWLGIVLLLSRHHDLAIAEARKLLELDQDYFLAYFIIGAGCRYLGRCEEAITAQRKAVELSGGAAVMLGWLGLTLAGSGKSDEAHKVLRRLQEMAANGGYVPPTSFAWIYLGLGEVDTAFEWLNRAVDDCDQLMMPIKSYVFLDPLREDPRFTVLLHKMNLER